MAIQEGYTANFYTLLRAAENKDLCLAECTDIKTKDKVMTICAVGRDSEGSFVLAPLAKLFDGNPYEEVSPPEAT